MTKRRPANRYKTPSLERSSRSIATRSASSVTPSSVPCELLSPRSNLAIERAAARPSRAGLQLERDSEYKGMDKTLGGFPALPPPLTEKDLFAELDADEVKMLEEDRMLCEKLTIKDTAIPISKEEIVKPRTTAEEVISQVTRMLPELSPSKNPSIARLLDVERPEDIGLQVKYKLYSNDRTDWSSTCPEVDEFWTYAVNHWTAYALKLWRMSTSHVGLLVGSKSAQVYGSWSDNGQVSISCTEYTRGDTDMMLLQTDAQHICRDGLRAKFDLAFLEYEDESDRLKLTENRVVHASPVVLHAFGTKQRGPYTPYRSAVRATLESRASLRPRTSRKDCTVIVGQVVQTTN
jgi:hypothetical protein